MKSWIKKNLSTIVLVLIFIVGLSLLLYPSVSDYWNSFHQSRAIATYAEAVAIEIPQIKVSLPIYHGVDEAVLQIAVGHIEGSSLPVGGPGTHSVISGHRGLPSASLFTNLDQLVEGDVFMMRVLDETLTYEVDQIRIVEPTDLSSLEREEDSENLENSSDIRVTADALQIDPVLVAPVVAVPILILLIIWILVYYRRKR